MFRLMLLAATVAAVLAVQPAAASTPHRIVSLSPTATESLFAIGAGTQVVAVDDQSDYPKRAPHTSLSGFTPNVEAIASYHPDLVVVQYDSGSVVEALRKLNIRVLVQPSAKNLTIAYAQIEQLAAITAHKRAAVALVARMKHAIAKAIKTTPRRKLSVYHELSPDYYSATSKTFIGGIYKLFGLRNIADATDSSGSGYPQLSAEYILGANPALIVLADTRCCGQSVATVSGRPGWSNISAVRTHSVVAVDDSVASRWGPRIVQFVQAVAKVLRKR